LLELQLLLLKPILSLLDLHIGLLYIGLNHNGFLILKGLHMHLHDRMERLLQFPLEVVVLNGVSEPIDQVVAYLVLLMLESG
jgi:hypothetical protein